MAGGLVCRMRVDEKKAAATWVCRGTTYYFCAAGCKKAFESGPEAFLGKK